jgi:hypothetical protein
MRRPLLTLLALTSMLFLATCGGSDDDDPDGLFALCNFQLNGSDGIANCALQNPATDAWIDDATVTVNGEEIPFVLEGSYQKMQLTGTFAVGDEVTLTITSSFGTATATGTIPASGATSVDVDGALEGSVFNISGPM